MRSADFKARIAAIMRGAEPSEDDSIIYRPPANPIKWQQIKRSTAKSTPEAKAEVDRLLEGRVPKRKKK